MSKQRDDELSRVLVHPLSYVRQERGWSLQDVANLIARRLNTASRREKVWRWENWAVEPDRATQEALADELGIPIERVRSLGWPSWLPVGNGMDFNLSWNSENGIFALDQAAGKAVLDRRGFLILAAGAATDLAKGWLSHEPAISHAATGGPVSPKVVGLFERRIPGLRSMDFAMGGESVRILVDAELRLVTDLLKKNTYSEATGKRLFKVAAELGRLAGWSSMDAGYHAAAERYWVAALRASHAAGDRAIGANILKSMSLQRVDSGRAKEALELAQAAVAGTKAAPARVRAMLATRQARTHAYLGEKSECDKALVQAESAMIKADGKRAPSWANYFNNSEFCAQVAACHLLLQRHEKADAWLAKSLEAQPESNRRDRATYLIWQADAAHQLGDIDRACSIVSKAIPDVIEARSARNRRRLAEINSQLFVHGTAETNELNEKVRTAVAA